MLAALSSYCNPDERSGQFKILATKQNAGIQQTNMYVCMHAWIRNRFIHSLNMLLRSVPVIVRAGTPVQLGNVR